jgi:hypothetical protein
MEHSDSRGTLVGFRSSFLSMSYCDVDALLLIHLSSWSTALCLVFYFTKVPH